jgi:hypothetical protein
MTTTTMTDTPRDNTVPKSVLGRVAERFGHLPEALRVPILTAVSRRAVPFIGTAGVRVVHLGADGVRLTLANRRRVRRSRAAPPRDRAARRRDRPRARPPTRRAGQAGAPR